MEHMKSKIGSTSASLEKTRTAFPAPCCLWQLTDTLNFRHPPKRHCNTTNEQTKIIHKEQVKKKKQPQRSCLPHQHLASCPLPQKTTPKQHTLSVTLRQQSSESTAVTLSEQSSALMGKKKTGFGDTRSSSRAPKPNYPTCISWPSPS